MTPIQKSLIDVFGGRTISAPSVDREDIFKMDDLNLDPLRYVAHLMERGIVYRRDGMSMAMDAWREGMRGYHSRFWQSTRNFRYPMQHAKGHQGTTGTSFSARAARSHASVTSTASL